ncbi:hypothetical protein P154DRAFT_439815 [Amniculicola lignicola CBS 123094]|uniref:DUF7703 domain-containing protein n=1 Tax=Amniculicola lignicola CBS 123094 TaxID=1392246 RepID=A0A6A5W862_9PLEO|nr:hypothetical protein P154DRAFT_439815 [Amniculicola lignicola CBS 123094]
MGTQYEVPYVNALVIASFLAIAWYNVAELTILIHTFFKRHAGLYYYSLLVANWGIFFHGLGMFLKFFKINDHIQGHEIANTVIVWLGWVAMITGQSIVLWSRLHLVVQATWTRWVLVMIIFNAVTLHITTGVLTFFTNIAKNPEPWKGPYSVVERIQVTLFFVQEVILSSIYIWKTTAMLRSEGPLFQSNKNVRGKRGRQVLMHTIFMSSIIIALDITLIGLEFSGIYDIQTSYKGAVYSVKLKMEFTILNQLMNLVKGNLRETTSSGPGNSKSAPTYGRNPSAIANSGLRSNARHSTALGHSAGAYAKMEDYTGPGGVGASGAIPLRDLKSTDVLKTTTTEVRVDKIERIAEDVESQLGEGKGTSSRSSSEVYIIEPNSNK